MILAIDVGNTNICLGVFDGDQLVTESRIDTNNTRMADQYAIMIREILALYDIQPEQIDGAVISSVVPTVTTQLKAAIKKLYGVTPLMVEPGLKTGLNIKIDDPSTLGADLACGAVAAKELYPLPCVVIDVGTATKVYALDKNGAMLGGIIAPGVKISLEALADKTAALPLINLGKVDNVIGTNTVDCMRSGILYGTAGMLDNFIERFQEQIGKGSVVATGGYSRVIQPYCRNEFEVNPNLLLEGLRIIYNKNVKKK